MFDQAMAGMRRGARWAAAALDRLTKAPRLHPAAGRIAARRRPTDASWGSVGERARRPRFVLEGALIVLPALLLAGVGFWSLGKDRALARAEAADRAQQLAADLAERLADALMVQLEAPPVDDLLAAAGAGRARVDPIRQCAQLDPPRVAFLVDGSAQLRYPPPVETWPNPGVLEVADLPAPRRAAWLAAQAAVFADADPAQGVAAWEAFLVETPPVAFAAQAAHTLGVLYTRLGETDRARPWFESVIREYPDAEGETGVPLRVWAELRLLQLGAPEGGTPVQRAAWLHDLCAQAVLRPSPLSSSLLSQAAALAGETERSGAIAPWLGAWDAHEFARRLFAVWRLGWEPDESAPAVWPVPGWLTLRSGQSWLVTGGPAPDTPPDPLTTRPRWIVALARDHAQELVDRVVGAVPNLGDLDFRIHLAGVALREPGGGGEALSLGETSAGGHTPPLISVGAFLTDPQALYARQHTRTRIFGLLIALSALAVLAGFATARRAFRRQQQLNELQLNFVSSVSHELRAPIASVRLMAEELHEGMAPEAGQAREYHRFMLQEARRLSALIENVLDFARHEQGRKQYEFEPTDVTALVRETAPLLNALAGDRGVAVATQLPPTPVTWELDGRAVQQVLVNLLDNAIKHSPAGSPVTVGLAVAPAASGRGPVLQLWVEDRGEGIPPEEQARIFQRFYRPGSELRRRTQGVGLGLAIVKFTVEAHGGRVLVRSAVGQGSRFTVELPWRDGPDPMNYGPHSCH